MEVPLQSFRKRFTYDPVKDLLGKGGFGEVYKAYDNEDHLFVALKIAQGITDDKYNLINEIKRFKKLNHPNIVKHIEAYEVNTGGTDIHGNPIIHHVGILEYADQGTFADLLKKGTNYRQIEDLAKDIIEGLAYLHSEGIIHRDLKPSNILLFKEGEKLRAKITDFGIAKRADATAASTQLVGTVEYMAPEYFTTGNITPASDVWSIGVMLLEALTGTHPFGKTTQGLNNQQIINQILNKEISSAIQPLNTPFKDMITRCLLRDTNLRPQSANELKGLLMEDNDTFPEMTQVIARNISKEKSLSSEIAVSIIISLIMGIVFYKIGELFIEHFSKKIASKVDVLYVDVLYCKIFFELNIVFYYMRIVVYSLPLFGYLFTSDSNFKTCILFKSRRVCRKFFESEITGPIIFMLIYIALQRRHIIYIPSELNSYVKLFSVSGIFANLNSSIFANLFFPLLAYVVYKILIKVEIYINKLE